MNLVTEPGPNGVLVVRGQGSLLDLDPDGVRSAFREHGALWFRGFDTDAKTFLGFIEQFADELITLNSHERVRHRDVHEIQSVTTGPFPLTFHTEFGHTPGRPDFLSFWCEVPSSKGGQTLLVDGVALWSSLSAPTQQLFLEKRLRYSMAMPKQWWTDRLGSDKREDVEAAVSGIPHFEFDIDEDGVLTSIWRTPAVFESNFCTSPCFASNVFPYVVPGLSVCFEDGSKLPEDAVAELCVKAEAIAAEIEWSRKEIVFFDNTRWLHGRRAVGGLRPRRVQMLQGYLGFAPPDRIRIRR
jgi:alpha-ketoglutarate-dependent taurine dioxygenase